MVLMVSLVFIICVADTVKYQERKVAA